MSMIALTFGVAIVIVLLRIERRHNRDASYLLWVPTFWMAIYASRPLGRWFEGALTSDAPAVVTIEAGSPLDRWVLTGLIACTLLIIIKRKLDLQRILKDNVWLVLLFAYLGISVGWSDIPFVSLKRWIRSIGDIIIALAVLSERRPFEALESVLRRCAYILIPFSLVLIKWFPKLGVAYGRWSGQQMWIGVADHKNSLGQLCALSAFFLMWSLFRSWRTGTLFKSSLDRADAFILVICLFLLAGPTSTSYSATSLAVLTLAAGSLAFLFSSKVRTTIVARNLRPLTIMFALMFLLADEIVRSVIAPLLGREQTLTGRTEFWQALIAYASQNPLMGVGYGGFWAPENPELVNLFTPRFILALAHNGYLAVYVELGIAGILMLMFFMFAHCTRISRTLERSWEWGIFGICLLLISLIYNNSEVCFLQSSNYMWSITVLLTIAYTHTALEAETLITP